MPSRDNSNDFRSGAVPVFLCRRVRHHHKKPAIDLAKGLPALFSVYDSILQRDKKRIAEHFAGILEADAVFALIGTVLCLIPLESDFVYIHIVTTFL